MQALILVGGKGTRLRPLTTVQPKPVVELVDRPFIVYMLEWLKRHGVTDIVFSCGYKPDVMREVLGDGTQYGVTLTYVEEPHVLGTGGALKWCEDVLEDRFLMLNGDVLTDIDLTALMAQHERTGARGTIALYPVDDPSAYGLVRLEADGRVAQFVEKPSPDEIDTNTVNAGAYVLDKSVLSLLTKGIEASIERDVFPRLVGDGLYGYVANGAYWLDIGTPGRYLVGVYDILDGNVKTEVTDRFDGRTSLIADGVDVTNVLGTVLVEEGASIAPTARLGPLAVIGAGATVGAGAVVERSVVMRGSSVGAEAVLRGCVVAEDVTIGDGTIVHEQAVIGRGARVGSGNSLGSGIRVAPGAVLPDEAIKV